MNAIQSYLYSEEGIRKISSMFPHVVGPGAEASPPELGSKVSAAGAVSLLAKKAYCMRKQNQLIAQGIAELERI
jgi:hypothetical protein